ncbi:FUSC family protein [Streptomyces maoxianensis]|uniref:FUSC family protein n=1 Tax=Streptomyces maoxianensis TaxID=1459942 RepID=A0ABV9G3E6_9ACTN
MTGARTSEKSRHQHPDTRKPERKAIVHRAVRVTVAASAGFYPLVYGLHQPSMSLYALFGPVALGMLSPIPGSGRQRAAVMLRALPVGLVLVALGTALAVRTWAAVLGMLVVGFTLAFAAVAGPRPAGAAPGLQLFYILACFPPYAPETLGARLAGLTLGVLLLAACEVFLLPAPPTASYRESLAYAVEAAGRAANEAAVSSAGAAGTTTPDAGPRHDAPGGPPGSPPGSPAGKPVDSWADRLRAIGQQLRFSQLPPAERPAGAGRVDRAMAQAGTATRTLLDQLARLGGPAPTATTRNGADADAASADLLSRIAALCATTAAALRTGRPQPLPWSMEQAIRDFQAVRVRQATGPPQAVPAVPELRRQAAVLGMAESARMLETAVRVGLDGRRTGPIPPRELFWYADSATARLWWRRLVGNMTLHSVQFQNAVRTALGLGAARLVAGSLDLTHGFWVLLAVLTLGRTTAGETWAAVRSALVGTLVGAVAAGTLLLVLGRHTEAYAAVLAPGMLAAFALGPLLGIAWAQALFTLVVSAAFAQLAPASWQLAEARIVDVVTGSVIGLLCGLIAWPAGARREVGRAVAGLLDSYGPLITGTVGALLANPPGSASLPSTYPTMHRLRLAETAYAQYRTEPGEHSVAHADWQAVLITANHILVGSRWLPRFDLPPVGVTPEADVWARTSADRLALTTARLAALCAGRKPPPEPSPSSAPHSPAEVPGAPPLPMLIDLEVWLSSLTMELRHIERSVPPLRSGTPKTPSP